MKKAGAIATRLGVHADTVRDWADEFEEFFSEGAKRGAGIRRVFTLGDEVILNTICEMRKRNVEFEEIRARLRSGERIEVLPAINETLPPETALEVYQKVTRLEIQLESALDDVERLRAQLNDKTENEITLRSKIAVLEYQIEQLRKSKSD